MLRHAHRHQRGGQNVAALRRLGFDGVFDTDTAADFTIMEEATEFVQRVKNGGTLPLITSCSPGWVNSAKPIIRT